MGCWFYLNLAELIGVLRLGVGYGQLTCCLELIAAFSFHPGRKGLVFCICLVDTQLDLAWPLSFGIR